MPLYEYRCLDCGNVFEQLVFGNSEPAECPKCSGKIEKMMSTFSFDIPDEICGKLPKGEPRERCTECREGGGQCSIGA
ncbi:MAG: zinc ribbon domain-containing protein [Syntrophobacteraceae bacterium]